MAQLIDNLSQLQNRIKREPETYREDFLLQLRSFDAQFDLFKLHPHKESKDFCKLIQFVSQVSHLYTNTSAKFLPDKLITLLLENHSVLDAELRRILFQSLVLLRNRGQVDPRKVIELSFQLFKCEDKSLRESLYSYILTDIRNINKKNTDLKLNKSVQTVLFNVLQGESGIAAKKSLQVIVELYKKRVWIDSRTVNVISTACFSSITKNVVVALQFFLGIDDQIDILEEEEQAPDEDTGEKINQKKNSSRFTKKTRARMRKLEKEVKALRKAKEAKKASAEARRAAAPRFPAIDLINDTQGFVDKLFKKLKSSTEHFEVRLMMMNLISRIVGHHRLLLMPFYSFCQRYLQPHQRHVTQILAYLIQASHDLIPPEEIEPIVKLIANNFVTDRSGSEVMAVGLNAIRELLVRIPLISNGEGMADLVSDLIQYRKYRRDRSVVIAARSFLNAIRAINPMILQRKERGKFHDANAKPLEYGASKALDGIEGAELLQQEEEADGVNSDQEGVFMDEANEDDSMDDEDEESGDEQGSEGEDVKESDQVAVQRSTRKRKLSVSSANEPTQKKQVTAESSQTKLDDNSEATTTKVTKTRIEAQRILSVEDFERIRELKRKADAAKKDPRMRRKKAHESVSGAKSTATRKSVVGNKSVVSSKGDEGFSDADDSEEEANDPAVFDAGNLEGVVKRRRKALAERLESVYAGRSEEDAKATRAVGLSNAQKEKSTKNFLMTQKSRRVKRKQKQSLRQQQYTLKRHIKTLEKKKKLVQKVRRRG